MLEACRAGAADARLTWVDAAFLDEQKIEEWSDLPAWVSSRGPAAGFGCASIARAVAAGLRFRPLAETARDTLAWWRTLPEERRAHPKAGLTPEREAEVLRAWHARRG
jgi:2'-hydroxyisoflavone reductase